jgi:hypothetical protein
VFVLGTEVYTEDLVIGVIVLGEITQVIVLP